MKSKINIKSILIVAVIGIFSLLFFNQCFAANTAKVNVETANIRKTADANSTIVEQAYKNQEVQILEKAGEWYKVKYNNIEGYLRKDLLDVAEENPTENANTSENNANVTETTDNTAVETSNVTENQNTTDGTNTTTTENTNTESNGAETTTQNTEDTNNTTEAAQDVTGIYNCKENVKLKIMPLINGNDIKELNKDTKVNVLEVNNKWALVESENNRGWVLISKIEKADNNANTETKQEEKANEEEKQEEQQNEENTTTQEKEVTMYVNSEVVNLRKTESTSSESIARLTKGTQLVVVSTNNGWSKVKVNNKEGYIASSLLSERKPETTTSRSLENERQEATNNNAQNAVQQTAPQVATETQTTATSSNKGQDVCNYAMQFSGNTRYVYGGTTPSGFDCSGFTQYVYKNSGVTLNRTAAAQYSNGTAVSRENLQVGDLIMFGSSASNINHVGIYTGNGTIVHAANPSRGVTTDTINSGYYNTHYVGARRIFN